MTCPTRTCEVEAMRGNRHRAGPHSRARMKRLDPGKHVCARPHFGRWNAEPQLLCRIRDTSGYAQCALNSSSKSHLST